MLSFARAADRRLAWFVRHCPMAPERTSPPNDRSPDMATSPPKRRITQRSLIVLIYLIATVAGATWFGGYLNEVGGKVPYLVWLTCGPLIALSNPHELHIYLAVTVIVLPLLVLAARPGVFRRAICAGGALAVWLYAGHWMFTG